MGKEKIKTGDRVKWQYTHHLNSNSSVERVKLGEYFGKVKHTVKYSGINQMAVVQFDGNKGRSLVPFNELEKTNF